MTLSVENLLLTARTTCQNNQLAWEYSKASCPFSLDVSPETELCLPDYFSFKNLCHRSLTLYVNSPGFIDIQLNGAYNFDFSVYEDDDSYREGMKLVAERIIETGVTS